MIRYTPSFFPVLLLVLFAVLSPFFFPTPFAVFVGIVVSLFFPPVAIVVGGLLDILYIGPSMVPYYTVGGIIVSIGAAFVHEFVKTRIIS